MDQLDTGPYLKKVAPRPSFLDIIKKVKNPKVGSFLRAPEDLEGLRNQKKLISQNTHKQVQTINSNVLLLIENKLAFKI